MTCQLLCRCPSAIVWTTWSHFACHRPGALLVLGAKDTPKFLAAYLRFARLVEMRSGASPSVSASAEKVLRTTCSIHWPGCCWPRPSRHKGIQRRLSFFPCSPNGGCQGAPPKPKHAGWFARGFFSCGAACATQALCCGRPTWSPHRVRPF